MVPLLGAWVLVSVGVLVVRGLVKPRGVGLVPAYLLATFALFFPGALAYAFRSYEPLHPAEVVQAGFQVALIGVIGFALGSVLVAPLVIRGLTKTEERRQTGDAEITRMTHWYLVLGALSYVALLGVVSTIPTATAIVSVGQQLVPMGLCLVAWQAKRKHDRRGLALAIGCTVLLPFATIVTQGFLSYGSAAALVVSAFIASQSRRQWVAALVGLALLYVGFSMFQTYMRDRDLLRNAVWGNQPADARVQQIGQTFGNIAWLDFNSQKQMGKFDDRLNQSFLVGSAVYRLNDSGGYAYGSTLVQAAEGLVPRIIWPSKPAFAGSGEVVSDYTGVQFGIGTSVGISSILELFINFGTLGVFLGMIVIGTIVTALDAEAGRRLAMTDIRGFVPVFLVGLAFLQVGGSFVEVTATAGASLVVAWIVNRRLRLERQTVPRPRPLPA